jgi:mannose-6-phosphate isomerase-like protein (cupin superfamily)
VSDPQEFFNRKPKRVVTGQRADGSSYFVSIEEVDQDSRGIGSHRMWASDRLPVQLPFLATDIPLDGGGPIDGLSEALRTSNGRPLKMGSIRVNLQHFPPHTEGDDTRPFLHWHDTFDVQWVMAGEMTITLDGDDRAVTMGPGDAVIQHGTNHAWRAGPEGCVLAIFLLGAERVGVSPPAENHRPG